MQYQCDNTQVIKRQPTQFGLSGYIIKVSIRDLKTRKITDIYVRRDDSFSKESSVFKSARDVYLSELKDSKGLGNHKTRCVYVLMFRL